MHKFSAQIDLCIFNILQDPSALNSAALSECSSTREQRSLPLCTSWAQSKSFWYDSISVSQTMSLMIIFVHFDPRPQSPPMNRLTWHHGYPFSATSPRTRMRCITISESTEHVSWWLWVSDDDNLHYVVYSRGSFLLCHLWLASWTDPSISTNRPSYIYFLPFMPSFSLRLH